MSKSTNKSKLAKHIVSKLLVTERATAKALDKLGSPRSVKRVIYNDNDNDDIADDVDAKSREQVSGRDDGRGDDTSSDDGRDELDNDIPAAATGEDLPIAKRRKRRLASGKSESKKRRHEDICTTDVSDLMNKYISPNKAKKKRRRPTTGGKHPPDPFPDSAKLTSSTSGATDHGATPTKKTGSESPRPIIERAEEQCDENSNEE